MATLTHEQMIEILRKPGSVTVVVVSPLPSGKPRKGVQASNQQYWWSARSSTSTISSYGGSATSVGDDHESRDHSPYNLKAPPRVAPKGPYKKPRSGDEMDTDGSSSIISNLKPHRSREDTRSTNSSISSVTGSSSTLNEDGRVHTPSYGAAYKITVTPGHENDSRTPSNQGSQGSSSSYENLNPSRPKWSGVSPVVEKERNPVPSSVGVTLKAPTSKGTLYVIASGPQSPGVSSKPPETPLFGSTSQRSAPHRRIVVDDHVLDGEAIVLDPTPARNGELNHERFVQDTPRDNLKERSNGENKKVPYKETTLGAVVTTTSTYTHENEELSEASMTETMDKIEKAFGFKTPGVTDSPRYDYGQFDRTSNLRKSGRKSPRGSTEDLKLRQRERSSESLNRQENAQEQVRKEGNTTPTIVAHEIKSEMARALSHEELQVQLILEELQQAEKDLGGTEGRIQTVVEVSRGNNEVIRESTTKNKEYGARLAQRNNIMERLESQRHAIGNEGVEGLKIYHAKSRSTPADVSKAQVNAVDKVSKSKHVSSQNDLTGRSKSGDEVYATPSRARDSSEPVQRRHSRRKRSERVEQVEQPETPRTPEARSVKPVVRSERKIKLSSSGGSGLSDEKASTLPRYQSRRKHRYVSKQPNDSDSTDEDFRAGAGARDRRTDANEVKPTFDKFTKSTSFPRDGEEQRRSSADNRTHRHPHLKGARITRLKLSASEEPTDSVVDQTTRLLSATAETKHDSNFVVTQDVLHSLTQASDLLSKNQSTVRDEKDRIDRRERDRNREREKEKKDKPMAKIKSHGHGRGKSHGPHKFHIPVVPRRHSFDDRLLANTASKPTGGESSFTRESIGREAELEMKLAIVSNALMKEGEEKQRVEADLKRALKENKKLNENLRTASSQLRKFTEWFFRNMEQNNS